MTTVVDIINRALQNIGTRTTVTAGELAANSSNEAIQANLIYENTRDDLIRMAPWDCVQAFFNLNYITSVPGTPENTSAGATQWAPGIPAPPWAYEYQYPVDCLRACYIVPQFATGYSGGVPITTAVTGGASSFWQGPPVKFKVSTDLFYPVTAAAVVAGGTGHAVGDIITLPLGATTSTPIGAAVKLQVATVAVGVILTVTVVNQVSGEATPLGGSYFTRQTGTIAQYSTTGSGTGATFTLTFGPQSSQRVILTNQEFAILAYNKQITDPNIMDTLFQSAWIDLLGAQLCIALSGDKTLANAMVASANNSIIEARKADGNEGLTVNDVTPDWIRIRGIAAIDAGWSPNTNFDWGSMWPGY